MSLQKKQEKKLALENKTKETKNLKIQKSQELASYAFEQGRKYAENLDKETQELIHKKRKAFLKNKFFVEKECPYLLVVRIKGLSKVAPKERKILSLFRLFRMGHAVFIKNNKATMNMLRRIEPYVTYGFPSRKTIKHLIYKRGFGKFNRQRIPLSSNEIIEQGLGQYGVKCIEDVVNEIYSFGKNFKEVNNFLFPFRLNSARKGLEKKRVSYLNNGAHGPRDIYINELVKRML
jgi:large subunit ribosomal protein L7e